MGHPPKPSPRTADEPTIFIGSFVDGTGKRKRERNRNIGALPAAIHVSSNPTLQRIDSLFGISRVTYSGLHIRTDDCCRCWVARVTMCQPSCSLPVVDGLT